MKNRPMKAVTAVTLIVMTVALPLIAQVLQGYCLSCWSTSFGSGCAEGSFLGWQRGCITCQGPTQDLPYACTACNWHKIGCVPLDGGGPCPPYRVKLVRFSNVASARPLVCSTSDDYILCREL
jgi:hypothetical protein